MDTGGGGLVAGGSEFRGRVSENGVESRKGAVWKATRFLSPLIKPDMPISSIRLSDRLHIKPTQVIPASLGCKSVLRNYRIYWRL
jgi:hypothetical protein